MFDFAASRYEAVSMIHFMSLFVQVAHLLSADGKDQVDTIGEVKAKAIAHGLEELRDSVNEKVKDGLAPLGRRVQEFYSKLEQLGSDVNKQVVRTDLQRPERSPLDIVANKLGIKIVRKDKEAVRLGAGAVHPALKKKPVKEGSDCIISRKR
jgi:hypothetical protein